MTDQRPAFAALGDQDFVSLSTFRRTGGAVATPVWIARDGQALLVTTPEESGKIKRLRNNPRVEIVPCNRFGKVEEGAIPVRGTAEILPETTSGGSLAATFPKKYGLEYRIFMAIERLVARRRKPRVLLRITQAS